MTNEEIDLKVANIDERFKYGVNGWSWLNDGEWLLWGDFPPRYSTKWSWCGPFLERYTIALAEVEPYKWLAYPGVGDSAHAETPQQAICLAVISYAKAMRDKQK